MKEIVSIQAVSLLVASTKPLPVFKTATAEFSEEYPGIFSIRHIHANLYSVEVSALSILRASSVLERLANSHEADLWLAARKEDTVNPQTSAA